MKKLASDFVSLIWLLGLFYIVCMAFTKNWTNWIMGYALMSPFPYLVYHGWASKNLIDTVRTDRMAWLFWICSLIFATSMAFKHIDCGI